MKFHLTNVYRKLGAKNRADAVRQAYQLGLIQRPLGYIDSARRRIPGLRGRIAYDFRFELYDEHALDELTGYDRQEAGWRTVVDGYRVVVVDDPAHLKALAAKPGARIAYKDTEIALVSRASPSRP